MNDILLNMNKRHVTILVLFDLSAAFDTVDHSFLLTDYRQNLVGKHCPWLVPVYLFGRSQRDSVWGAVSDKFDLGYGVSQGSCLGPLLFTVYAAHCLMSSKSTSQLFIVMPMTLSYISCLVPRRTLARLMQLLMSKVAFKTAGGGCIKTSCSWLMPKQNFFSSTPDSNMLKSQLMP